LPLGLALALACSGCSTTYQWVKEGATRPQADSRYAACQLEAERLRWSTDEDDEERAARVQHEAQLCMRADGWRRVRDDGEAVSESAELPVRSTRPAAASAAAEATDGGRTSGGAATSAGAEADAERSGDDRSSRGRASAADRAAKDDEDDEDDE
jgi:hypothetical protein